MNPIKLTVFILVAIVNWFNTGVPGFSQVAEKVYLHIDRNIYNPGEDIWFKAYVIDAATNRLSESTGNLHVELVSPDSKIIQSRTLKVASGMGNGDFHLNELIPSGRYRIRAYTNFMRNFTDPHFFDKEIVIINASDALKGDSTGFASNTIDVVFFPEGGSLVENINSVVAFKAIDASGKGCDITGEVFSSAGDTISKFRSTHLGMGSFIFKPWSRLKYYAVVRNIEGKEYRAELPRVFPDGVSIHALVTPNNSLQIRLSLNETTLSSIKDHDLAISISSRYLVIKHFSFRINTLAHNLQIPLDGFPDGVLRITLSGIDGLPISERLVFVQKANPPSLSLSTDKASYKPREQVRFTLSLSADSLVFGKTNLSFSAAESGSCNNLFSNISSWFLLESDISGPVENPSSYFDISNLNRLQEMDLLLLTQGWRDFQWKYDPAEEFKREYGFPVSGRARRMLGKRPPAGARINIALFNDKTFSYFVTQPDSAGRFKIDRVDIEGNSRAVISITDKNNTFYGWLNVDSLFYKPAPVEIISTGYRNLTSINYSELKQEAIVKLILKKKYKLNDTIQVGEVSISSRKREVSTHVESARNMYNTPDNELIVTPELENRPDIYSVMSGRIPGVEATSTGGISVRGQNPLVLLDGIPGREDVIPMITPSMIDRIDVLYWSSLYGHQGANGIVNIITKSGQLSNSESHFTHSAKINIKGYDIPRIFYSPKYNTREPLSYLSDNRTTILWEPDIVLEKGKNVSISCFNADKTGSIHVLAEGITSEGIPVFGETNYVVR